MRFFFSNAPFSMLAAALPGIVNYGVLIFLTHDQDFEQAGSYRLLLSIHGLIGLAAMAETRKIYVRSIVTGEEANVPALWINRLLFATLPFLVISVCALAGLIFGASYVPAPFIWIAGISALIYATDFYVGHLQARASFSTLFSLDLIKYSAAVTVFVFAMHREFSVDLAVIAMFATIAFANLFFTIIFTRNLFQFTKLRGSICALLRSSSAGQARTYSVANMLPASLEHIDKLLVGWVFGLEWLGIYALAFSTGRLVYNSIKPAFYIYYRRFVDLMPSSTLLWKLAIVGTIAGMLLTAAFLMGINHWQAMEKFKSGATVTVILFLGYGIGIVRAVYSQAFALNRNSLAADAWRASLWACLLTMPLLVAALLSKPAVALLFLALQYPVRDAATFYLLATYRRLPT